MYSFSFIVVLLKIMMLCLICPAVSTVNVQTDAISHTTARHNVIRWKAEPHLTTHTTSAHSLLHTSHACIAEPKAGCEDHSYTEVPHLWLVEKLHHTTVRLLWLETCLFCPASFDMIWSDPAFLSLKISQLESELINRIIATESLAFKMKSVYTNSLRQSECIMRHSMSGQITLSDGCIFFVYGLHSIIFTFFCTSE